LLLAIISLNSINKFIFPIKTRSNFFATGTEFLNIIQMNFVLQRANVISAKNAPKNQSSPSFKKMHTDAEFKLKTGFTYLPRGVRLVPGAPS
jgi:hypothetical protein